MAGPKKDRPILEAALQNVEVAFDLVTDNEAVRAIPIIGTAFKICKGVDDIRSKAFASKLLTFLSAPELQSEGTKRKLKAGIIGSPDDAQKVGETLFLVLERMTDLEKPKLLARVFVAFMDEVISSVEVRRLAQAIDAAFADDLLRLVSWSGEIYIAGLKGEEDEWRENLIVSGLTGSRTQLGTGTVEFYITNLGVLYRKAMAYSNDG